MVAAVCVWHERHLAAVAEIEGRLERGERLVTLAPALAEAYSVLTRFPPPHRLSPSDAWQLLKTSFVEHAKIISISGASYISLLGVLAEEAIGGGRTYDAIIGECAREAQASALLTFNRRHFDPPPKSVSVVEPGARG